MVSAGFGFWDFSDPRNTGGTILMKNTTDINNEIFSLQETGEALGSQLKELLKSDKNLMLPQFEVKNLGIATLKTNRIAYLQEAQLAHEQLILCCRLFSNGI